MKNTLRIGFQREIFGTILGVVTGLFFLAAASVISIKLSLLLLLSAATVILLLVRDAWKPAGIFLLTILLVINIDKNFFLVPNHIGGIPGLNLSLWEVVLYALVFFAWVRHRGHLRIPLSLKIFLLLLILFILWSSLSLFVAVKPNLSIFHLIQWGKILLLLIFLQYLIVKPSDLQIMVYALISVFIFESGIAVLQIVLHHSFNLGILADNSGVLSSSAHAGSDFRILGTMGNSNDFAKYLNLVIFLFLGLTQAGGSKKRRFFLLLLSGVGIMLLIYTQSRGAWVAFIIGLLLWLFSGLVFKRGVRFSKNTVLLLVTGLLVFIYPLHYHIQQRLERPDYGSSYSRIPMMQVAWNVIQAHPLLGIGVNNYLYVMTDYDNTEVQITKTFRSTVHNLYLQVTAETGIPGLLLFLLLLLAVLLRMRKNINFAPKKYRQFQLGVFCGFITFLIHSLVDNSDLTQTPSFIFWIYIALSYIIVNLSAQEFYLPEENS